VALSSNALSDRPITAPGFCGGCTFPGKPPARRHNPLFAWALSGLRTIVRRWRYLMVAVLRCLRGDRGGVVLVDPATISRTVNRSDPTLKRNDMWHFGTVRGGDWDIDGVPIREYGDIYQILKCRVEEGRDFDEIPEFIANLARIRAGEAPDNCHTEEQYRAKWRCIEALFERIRTDGYLSQAKLRSGHPYNEIRVQVGRNGDLLFEEGIHRLVVAQLLGIDTVPVIVTRRHRECRRAAT
jgi:hypothetical protein